MMHTILSRTACVAIVIVGSMSPGSVLRAEYAVLDGLPVTQGQMRVVKSDFDQADGNYAVPQTKSVRPGCFILKETTVTADVSAVLARVRVRQTFENPYWKRTTFFRCQRMRLWIDTLSRSMVE